MDAATKSRYLPERTWTDKDGDTLAVDSCMTGHGGHALQLEANNAGNCVVVQLGRAAALELRDHVQEYLGRFPESSNAGLRGTVCAAGAECDSNTCIQSHPVNVNVKAPLPDAEADGYSWGPALYRAHLLSTHGQIGRALSAAEPPPNRHAIRTAHLWTALLSDKLAEGEFLTVGDVRRLREAERLSADVGESQ